MKKDTIFAQKSFIVSRSRYDRATYKKPLFSALFLLSYHSRSGVKNDDHIRSKLLKIVKDTSGKGIVEPFALTEGACSIK